MGIWGSTQLCCQAYMLSRSLGTLQGTSLVVNVCKDAQLYTQAKHDVSGLWMSERCSEILLSWNFFTEVLFQPCSSFFFFFKQPPSPKKRGKMLN